jgi:hypothetical protein
MRDISLHILDIVQNSLNANALLIRISITENIPENTLRIEIEDNGNGMSAETLQIIRDPFYTTGKKKTGMGISLLEQNAQLTGGDMQIESMPGKGTLVKVWFTHNHIDRQPLGNMADTLFCIVRANPNIDFVYEHKINEKEFHFDTREIKSELEDMSINNPVIMTFIREMIEENEQEIAL